MASFMFGVVIKDYCHHPGIWLLHEEVNQAFSISQITTQRVKARFADVGIIAPGDSHILWLHFRAGPPLVLALGIFQNTRILLENMDLHESWRKAGKVYSITDGGQLNFPGKIYSVTDG